MLGQIMEKHLSVNQLELLASKTLTPGSYVHKREIVADDFGVDVASGCFIGVITNGHNVSATSHRLYSVTNKSVESRFDHLCHRFGALNIQTAIRNRARNILASRKLKENSSNLCQPMSQEINNVLNESKNSLIS